MKQYLCSVKLADSTQHVVPNKLVTIPEIAVLRAVHGENAVVDIRPARGDQALAKGILDKETVRTEAEERERLSKRYDNATPGDNDPVTAKLFPRLGPLPRTLREIGIDPQAAAEAMRQKAEELAASAAMLADEDEAPAAEADELDAMFDDEPAAGKKAKAA